MSTSRRDFLRAGALAVTGAVFIPKQLFAEKRKKEKILGLQLYTVRDDMHKDPSGTLKQIAAIGYKYVEHAGYANRKFYGYSVPDFKKLLTDNGLKMDSGHSFLGSGQWNSSSNDFTTEWKQTIEDAAAVGMKYLISPGLDQSLCKTQDNFNHYIQMFNKTGELCKTAGIHFAYHNESYEFDHQIGGRHLYDIILQDTDRALVFQQMDIGNMYGSGGRALQYLKKYPGRFLLMHVKDEIKSTSKGDVDNGYESTILGKGLLPVKEIIDTAWASGGTRYFIIEQESYQGKPPVECSKDDYIQMKKWGF